MMIKYNPLRPIYLDVIFTAGLTDLQTYSSMFSNSPETWITMKLFTTLLVRSKRKLNSVIVLIERPASPVLTSANLINTLYTKVEKQAKLT